MRGALTFALIAAIVGGGAMAATLLSGHELGHAWWLPFAAAGASGIAGFVLGAVTNALTRTK